MYVSHIFKYLHTHTRTRVVHINNSLNDHSNEYIQAYGCGYWLLEYCSLLVDSLKGNKSLDDIV